MNYHAYIQNEVVGPLTIDELKDMAQMGTVEWTTPIKAESEEEWSDWRTVGIVASRPATQRIEALRAVPPPLHPQSPRCAQMTDRQFFVQLESGVFGPISMAQLHQLEGQRAIHSLSLVQKQGSGQWKRWLEIRQPGAVNLPPQLRTSAGSRSIKQRGIFIILGLLFGGMGLHNFYAGFYGRGAAQLILSLISLFCLLSGSLIGAIIFAILGIWILIELIATDTDAEGLKLA